MHKEKDMPTLSIKTSDVIDCKRNGTTFASICRNQARTLDLHKSHQDKNSENRNLGTSQVSSNLKFVSFTKISVQFDKEAF